MSFMVNQISVHHTESIKVKWDSDDSWFDIRMVNSEGKTFEVTIFSNKTGDRKEISDDLREMVKQLRNSCNEALEN